jgi:hypothetical protein
MVDPTTELSDQSASPDFILNSASTSATDSEVHVNPKTAASAETQPTHPPISPGWSPIIYGRTYEVDFRFLVTPVDFSKADKDWIWDYIKVTTRSAETLPGKPRWLFFRGKSECVVGVTCMVRDLMVVLPQLLPQPLQPLPDMTRDRLGRPLYAFVGYHAMTNNPGVIPEMDLKHFLSPYLEFIPQKWFETYATLANNQSETEDLKVPYHLQFRPEDGIQPAESWQPIPIEQLLPRNYDEIALWNTSEAQNIWWTAVQAPRRLSICIGNLARRDLVNSKFRVAAIEEVQQQEIILRVDDRQISPPSQPALPSESVNSIPDVPTTEEYSPHSSAKQSLPAPRQALRDIRKGVHARLTDFFGESSFSQFENTMFDLGANVESFTPVVDTDGLEEFEERLSRAIEVELEKLRGIQRQIVQLEQQGQQEDMLFSLKRQAEGIRNALRQSHERLSKAQDILRRRGRPLSSSSSTGRAPSSSQSRPNPMRGFKPIEPSEAENAQTSNDPSPKSPPKKDIWDF